MTRGVIRDGAAGLWPEVGLEVPRLVLEPQELADVVHVLGNQLRLGCVDAQQFPVVRLQLHPAARPADDDGDALRGVGRQLAQVRQGVTSRLGKVAVRLHRQAAAVLGREDHLEAAMLQHRDDGLAHLHLVVLRRAPVEIGHLRRTGRRRRLLALVLTGEPAAKLLEVEGREGRVTVDGDDLFHQDAHRPESHHRVGQGRDPAAHLTEHLVVAESRVAPPLEVERVLTELLFAQFGLRRGVDLHHLDAVRTHQRADAAARTVVQRVVGRGRAGIAEPLRLRPDVLRAGKQVGDRQHRARAGADVALDAQVGAALDVFE